jgi:creatinine amidohydrolase
MDARDTHASPVRWSDMSWPQIDALDRERTVLLLPTGAIEQHGRHLPVDTDIHDSLELSIRAAAATASTIPAVVLPPVWWGMSPHHMGYPGTISLPLETYSVLLRDICAAVARHGFRRVLIVNGHGGNVGILSATVMRITEELGLFVGAVSYWHLIVSQLRDIGTSQIGGMGHACEMETSLQLHLRPELVSMADARTEIGRPLTPYSTIDFRATGPLMIALDFRRDSSHGVMGDPTVATAEKGAAIAHAAVGELVGAIKAFGAVPLDGHEGTPRPAGPATVSDT